MTTFWLTALPPNPALSPYVEPGRIVGAGPDFWNFMNDPAEWSAIAPDLAVMQLYSDQLGWVTADQQRSFYTWAAENKIPLAFSAGVISYDDGPILSEISEFLSNGGSLSYIDMDEPYASAAEERNPVPWSATQVANDAAGILKQIVAMAPGVKIVDQEPVPLTSAANLAAWCQAYQAAMGRPLDGLQLDVDFNYGNSVWIPALVNAVETLEACGVPPGIIIDSEEPTDMGWCDDAILHYVMCRALFGDTIAVYDFQTWMQNPTDLLSDTNPAALTNVEYAAQFYDQIGSMYEAVLSRAPTQTEYIAAMRALSSGLLTTQQLQENLQNTGEGVTQSAIYDGDSQTAIFLPGSISAVTISSNDETVIAADQLTIINCPLADANDNFVGYSSLETFVELSGAGTLNPGWPYETLSVGGPVQMGDLTSNVTFVMDSDEFINISPSLGLSVFANGTNDVIALTWDPSIIETESANNTSPVVTGNSDTVLYIYGAGIVDSTNEIIGVGTINITPQFEGDKVDFIATGEENTIINDELGGDTIEIGSATQTVVNDGNIAINVVASAAEASANIIGQSGGATLDISSPGTFTLGSRDANLIVKIPSFSNATLNTLSFVTADGTAGNLAVTIGAANQTILAGPSDVVTDPSTLGYNLIGDSYHLGADLLVGFNGHDTIDISDFSATYTLLSEREVEGFTVVKLQQGLTNLVLNIAGTIAAGSLYTSSDGNGGTILSVHPGTM